MADLRKLFESAGVGGVETFIASGNVIFDARGKAEALERKIEAHLQKVLGYEVATFIRTLEEVHAIARYTPFKQSPLGATGRVNVGFLAEPPSAAATRSLMSHRSKTDDFHVRGREAYWLTATLQSESPFFKVGLEKALTLKATVRGMSTIQKLAAKYPLEG
jgi:uncharacterized protein (DUF1697 family)